MPAGETSPDRPLSTSDTVTAFRKLGLVAARGLLDEEDATRCRSAASRLLPAARPRAASRPEQGAERAGDPGPARRITDVHQVSPAFADVARAADVVERVRELTGVDGVELACCVLWFHEPHTSGMAARADRPDDEARTDIDVYVALDPLSDRHGGIVVDVRLPMSSPPGDRAPAPSCALRHIGLRPGDALILASNVPRGFSNNAGQRPLHVLHLGYRHLRPSAPAGP
jgi:hypothetical protein